DFFSILLTASNIGKYPKSCLASGLLRRHVGILPIDKYIGCSWLLPNVSVVVASEYKISDNNLAPVGKDLVFRIFGSDPDRISQKSGLDPTRSESEKNYL